jgi:tetratricopeptide (TPR) repeat protein
MLFVVRSSLASVSIVLLTLALVVVGPIPLQAQDVELLYREKKFLRGERVVQIRHSDAQGRSPADTSAFRTSERIYFTLDPVGDWTWSPDDTGDALRITLLQNTTELSVVDIRVYTTGVPEPRMILAYPKEEVDLTEPVVFAHAPGRSAPLSIHERYVPGYNRMKARLATARNTLDAAPLEAAATLAPFEAEGAGPSFSFAPEARALLDTAVTRVLDRQARTFTQLQDSLGSLSTQVLDQIDAYRSELDSVHRRLSFYLDGRTPSQRAAADEMAYLRSSAATMQASAVRAHRKQRLRIFMRGTYGDDQLRTSLDVLVRLLLDPQPAYAHRQPRLAPLRLEALDAPRFRAVREEMQALGWWEDLRETTRIVNASIRDDSLVFGEEVMLNLKLKRPAAPQPYYEIIAAMNRLGQGDRETFERHVRRALAKATDLSLINDLQVWQRASALSPARLDARTRSLLREGRAHWRAGRLAAAKEAYQLASRLTGSYAPIPYALGQISVELGDPLVAQTYFDQARALTPTYLPPEIRTIDLLLEREAYAQALARADSALARQAAWTLYFAKARALAGLERHDEARQVLRGRCEPLNDESVSLYLLLGDTYRKLDEWAGARWAYQQAGALEPENEAFVTRMRELQHRAQQAGISLDGPPPEDVTATQE